MVTNPGLKGCVSHSMAHTCHSPQLLRKLKWDWLVSQGLAELQSKLKASLCFTEGLEAVGSIHSSIQ